jgi:hypothetical protein
LTFQEPKKENLKAKIYELELTVTLKLSDTCIGTPVILRRVTSLELI